MNRQQLGATATTLLLLALGSFLVGGCVLTALAGYSVTWDEAGLQLHNVAKEAEAQAVLVQTEQARLDAELQRETQEAVKPAKIAMLALWYLGAGIAGVVLVLSLAFGAGMLITKRASVIYADSKGQYPVITRRLWNGVTIVHDPNRALGPTTVYTTPGIVSTVFDRLGVEHKPMTEFPAPADTETMKQIATQAQAVGLVAAQNRWPDVEVSVGGRSAGVQVSRRGEQALPEPSSARMPVIEVIDQPQQIESIKRSLLECKR